MSVSGGDSIVFRYFERDHLGSVVAVLDDDEAFKENTYYLACGIPSTSLSAPVDNHRHGGTERIGFAGLGWHDHRAHKAIRKANTLD